MSISFWVPTPSFDVANQSCQTSVIRSTSGRDVRTIRSSHQQWSWPHASAGASGRPLSSCGVGPTSFSGPGVEERVDGAVEPELRERLGLARARAEAGTPEQPLGLRRAELARGRPAAPTGCIVGRAVGSPHPSKGA